MSLDRLFLLPLALGHLALFVLAVNLVHGSGHPERAHNLAKVGLLALFLAISGWLISEAMSGPMLVWSWPSLVYGAVCAVTGLIVFPATTAYLRLRPRPRAFLGRETVVNLAEIHGRDALSGPGKYGWLLRVPGNESFRLRKTEFDVPLAGLSPALDGLSVLHLSDLHLAPSFDRRFFEAVIAEATGWDCDLVVFTGDLVDDDGASEWVVPLFSRLRGRLGSYAILGNHDRQHQPERLRRLLVEAGFVDLEGAWAMLDVGGARVAIGGTSYPWGPPLALADRPRADFQILLSHAPDRVYWAERSGFDLMLSGHNHGGQIRFPVVGPVFMPSRYSRRFDRGFFRKGKLTLHVSQGVAGKHPIRYGCPPEMTRLVLRSSPARIQDKARGRMHGAVEDDVSLLGNVRR